MKVNILGGAYKGRSATADSQECLNMYLEPDYRGGRNALVTRPGLTQWYATTPATPHPVRGLKQFGDYLLAVIGADLNVFDSNGTLLKNKESVLSSNTGSVSIATNGTQCLVSDGTYGYGYDYAEDEFAKLTEADHNFIAGGNVDFLNGYFVSVVPNSYQYQYSSFNDANESDVFTWEILDYSYAQRRGDDIVRLYVDHNEIICFKESSVEYHFHAGDSEATFRANTGVESEVGCRAPYSVTSLDNTLYWLDETLSVRVLTDYAPQIVSTPQLSYQWGKYSETSDAIGYGFRFAGKAFYVLSFPTADESWLYEVSARNWSKIGSKRLYLDGYGRFFGNCYEKFNDLHLFGDYRSTGKIFRLDDTVMTDDGDPILQRRVTDAVRFNDTYRRMPIGIFELIAERGVGNANAVDPQVMLRISKDGGRTWGKELWRSLGAQGEYGKRIKWTKLGAEYERVFEISVSDPVKVAFLEADIKIGR